MLGERSQPLERAARRGRAGSDLRRSDRGVHAGDGALLLGVLATALTVAAYAPGLDRGLGYDSAATVGYFVDTPSMLDAFRRQVDLNNQPLFSFLERLVIVAAHNRSEVVLRALPVLAGAAAVGLLVAAAVRRHGVLAGLCAGLFTGANAIVAYYSREVRSYSLLAFASVASTLLLYGLLRDDRRLRGWGTVGYCLTLALGLGVHLYMVFVLLGQAAIVVARRRLDWRWVGRWLVGTALGVLPYLGIAAQMIGSPGRGRGFLPKLPLDVVTALLGAYPPASVPGLALMAAVVLTGGWTLRHRRDVRAATLTVVAAFLLLWLVVQPRDTYPRFFIWAVPALGWLVAVAVARYRWLAIAVVAGTVLLMPSLGAVFTGEIWTFRDAARYVDAAAEMGRTACAISPTTNHLQPLVGYTDRFTAVSNAAQLDRCDLVVDPFPGRPRQVRAAIRDRRSFPDQVKLPGVVPGLVVARQPVTPLPEPSIGSRPGRLRNGPANR